MDAILDTSVLISSWRPPPEDDCAISTISLAELHFGVLVTDDPQGRTIRLRRLTAIERAFEPIPVSATIAEAYAALADATTRVGRQPRRRAFDLLIAATAIAEQATLYTFNADDLAGLEPLVRIAVPLTVG